MKVWDQQTDNLHVIALSKFDLHNWALKQIKNRLNQLWLHLHLLFLPTALSFLGKEKARTLSWISLPVWSPSPVQPETYRYSAIHLTLPLGHLLVPQRTTLDLQQPVWNKFKRRLGVTMKCFNINTSFPLWVYSIWIYQ